MFYDTATNKTVLMFQGYAMTFLSQFPLHTNASCMFVTLLLSFQCLLQRIPSFFPRVSPGRRFLTLQTAARAQISAYKVCVIESCYKPRHVTRVSVLGKATKSKDKNSRVLAKEDFCFFKGRTPYLNLWMWRWLTVFSCKECKRVLIIIFWWGKYFKTLHFSKNCY